MSSILSLFKKRETTEAPPNFLEKTPNDAVRPPVPVLDVKVKMLRTAKGSLDGRTVTEFRQGEIYNISKRLADTFVAQGWAEEV